MDYHSGKDTLNVGDLDVGVVLLNREEKYISELPCARMEAEMIGKLLELEPSRILRGEHDTKHAVLNYLNETNLIHFTAHGDAVRGEICLAPIRYVNKSPEKNDFILNMGSFLLSFSFRPRSSVSHSFSVLQSQVNTKKDNA